MSFKNIIKNIFIFSLLLNLNACMTTQQRYHRDYSAAKQNFATHNYNTAFRKIQSPAQAGNPDAQYALGYMYYNGLGTVADHQQAAYWFQKAAKKGQPAAQKALQEINANDN